jgi:polysaccharide pyruvyl transferase WcaK-like protein
MTKNSHLKVCLLGASFATNNLGVSALTAGAIQAILHRFPEAEIVLLDYGKQRLQYDFQVGDRKVPVQLVNMRFSQKLYLPNHILVLILTALILKLIPFQKLRAYIISKNFWLKQIDEAGLIAALAGGDSFSDIYGLGRLFYMALPQLLVLLMGKKLFLLPQTLGPFHSRIARAIAKYIINHASLTYSRDLIGQELVKKIPGLERLNGKLRFCYDVGFVVDPIPAHSMALDCLLEKKKANCRVIGINISGLLFIGGYTRNNMFGLRVDYHELIYDTIHFLLRKPDVVVLLVPHVFGPPTHAESDVTVCTKIYHELKAAYKDRLFLARGDYNQNEIKYIIGLCDFFVGSRMHACIAALSQFIPAVAISYSHKFFGVMQTVGIESLVADPCEMNKQEIMYLIEKAFEERDSFREQLKLKMSQVKARVLNLFDEINELA